MFSYSLNIVTSSTHTFIVCIVSGKLSLVFILFPCLGSSLSFLQCPGFSQQFYFFCLLVQQKSNMFKFRISFLCFYSFMFSETSIPSLWYLILTQKKSSIISTQREMYKFIMVVGDSNNIFALSSGYVFQLYMYYILSCFKISIHVYMCLDHIPSPLLPSRSHSPS